LDKIDGLTCTSDWGGVKTITEVMKNARGHVVLTANNAYEPRSAALRSYCLMLEFKKPSAGDVAKHLKRICEGEKIQADENALKFIAQRSEGDVRSAVNDLQALGQGKERLTYEDVSWLGHRGRQDTIFNVLRQILYAKTCSGAKQAVDLADVDVDFLFEWIYENVPTHFTDPHDLADAMDALAIADIYHGRIRRTQEWGLLRYVIDFMTVGVAMARKNTRTSGFVPFRFPERIQMLSRSRAERTIQREIGVKIKAKNHISAVRAIKEFIPYLKIIFQNNVKMAAGLAKWLRLDEEMVRYLTDDDTGARTILERMNLTGN
jgi:replication factor C large subunit